MQEFPQITTSRGDIVVDAVSFRPALFGLLGRPQWIVSWRSVQDPLTTHTQKITRDCTAGAAEIAGEPFTFIVRWRGDLRRPVLRDRSVEFDDVVTPQSVLGLARIR